MVLGLGVLVAAINAESLYHRDEYYVQALFFTPLVFLLGLFMVIVGNPVDANTGEPAVWARAGYGCSVGVGLLLGGLALWFVGC